MCMYLTFNQEQYLTQGQFLNGVPLDLHQTFASVRLVTVERLKNPVCHKKFINVYVRKPVDNW